MMESNNRLSAAVIQVVETQIESNDPPEMKQTFERLITEGFSEEVAKELLGTVVIAEVFGVLKDGEPFNRDRYVSALNLLPQVR